MAPKELSDVNYDDIIRTMTNHYKSAIVEIFIFNKCNRKPSQAISAYVAELSRTCAFGENADGVTLTSQLIVDGNLRDCFLCVDWRMLLFKDDC